MMIANGMLNIITIRLAIFLGALALFSRHPVNGIHWACHSGRFEILRVNKAVRKHSLPADFNGSWGWNLARIEDGAANGAGVVDLENGRIPSLISVISDHLDRPWSGRNQRCVVVRPCFSDFPRSSSRFESNGIASHRIETILPFGCILMKYRFLGSTRRFLDFMCPAVEFLRVM